MIKMLACAWRACADKHALEGWTLGSKEEVNTTSA